MSCSRHPANRSPAMAPSPVRVSLAAVHAEADAARQSTNVAAAVAARPVMEIRISSNLVVVPGGSSLISRAHHHTVPTQRAAVNHTTMTTALNPEVRTRRRGSTGQPDARYRLFGAECRPASFPANPATPRCTRRCRCSSSPRGRSCRWRQPSGSPWRLLHRLSHRHGRSSTPPETIENSITNTRSTTPARPPPSRRSSTVPRRTRRYRPRHPGAPAHRSSTD